MKKGGVTFEFFRAHLHLWEGSMCMQLQPMGIAVTIESILEWGLGDDCRSSSEFEDGKKGSKKVYVASSALAMSLECKYSSKFLYPAPDI